MQSFYPERFERDMACTEAEWLRCLPAAIGAHRHEVQAGCARVTLAGGELRLQWQAQPARAVALLRLPRLQVAFAFYRVPDQARHAFMQRFDLYLQRGGG